MHCVVYNAARLWYWSLHVKMWKLLHQMLYVTFIVLNVICEVLVNKLFKSIWISVFPQTEMKRVYMYFLCILFLNVLILNKTKHCYYLQKFVGQWLHSLKACFTLPSIYVTNLTNFYRRSVTKLPLILLIHVCIFYNYTRNMSTSDITWIPCSKMHL